MECQNSGKNLEAKNFRNASSSNWLNFAQNRSNSICILLIFDRDKSIEKSHYKLVKENHHWVRDVCDLWSHLFFVPVPDPTMSLLGDSDIASARRSRRPSSVCSMEDMWRRPKLSGQLPQTSRRVMLRSKAPGRQISKKHRLNHAWKQWTLLMWCSRKKWLKIMAQLWKSFGNIKILCEVQQPVTVDCLCTGCRLVYITLWADHRTLLCSHKCFSVMKWYCMLKKNDNLLYLKTASKNPNPSHSWLWVNRLSLSLSIPHLQNRTIHGFPLKLPKGILL